ncbi:hypothetical protein ACQ4PT_041701 [Festuca glaucescens]
METQHAETSDPTTAVVARRPWVLLDRLGHRNDHVIAEDATVASSRTSTGKDIQVSFRFAAPPATSRLYLGWVGGPSKENSSFAYPRVIAAHADSVLLQLTDPPRIDYFVYKAGSGGPPSLSLLPQSTDIRYSGGPALTRGDQRQRMVDRKAIGVLRRRADHAFAVAELSKAGGEGTPVAFELCVLISPGPASTSCKTWELRHPQVRDAKGFQVRTLTCWETDAVVPVGGRSLCWVDYYHGLLLGHVLQSGVTGSVLTYVPLPVDTPWAKPDHGQECSEESRSLGVVNGDTVRFANVDRGPLSIFTLTVWTLNNASMEWDKDGELRAADLWAFSGYENLPHVPPEYPVVSMDDPDGLFFLVSEGRHAGAGPAADNTVWLVEVDTMGRAVRSVARYSKEETTTRTSRLAIPDDDDDDLASVSMFHGLAFLPSEVSKYPSRSDDPTVLHRDQPSSQRNLGSILPRPRVPFRLSVE